MATKKLVEICADNGSQEDLVLQNPEVLGTVLQETSPSRLLHKSPLDGEAPSQKVGERRRKGDNVPGYGVVPPFVASRTRPRSLSSGHAPKGGSGKRQQPAPGSSLGPPDFHLLALKCHPSSAPLPATPHRAAAPSTAPAARAWRHSPVGLARGPWGAGSRRAQGTDSCSGGARPCLPAPRPTLSPATARHAPGPPSASRGPSRRRPLCSREETLPTRQQRAQLAPRVPSPSAFSPAP